MTKLMQLITFMILSFSSMITGQNIYRSACNGDLTRLDSLLSHFDINEQDEKGRTLLHWAVACQQKEIFDELIRRAIHINRADHQEKTPLHIAVNFNRMAYVDELIKVQPNEDWKALYGGDLLSLAILEANEDMIQKLLNYGIDVNALNSRGNKPVELSKRLNLEHITNLFISHGADDTPMSILTPAGDYLDDNLPQLTPQVFAPNFISTEEYEFGSVFNRDMSEFYYGVDVTNGNSEIRVSYRNENGEWSKSEVLLSHPKYGYNDPFLSPDDSRLYFISQRPLDGSDTPKRDHDIWYIERQEDAWSQPINVGPNINTDGPEYYISFTKSGTMYFASDKNVNLESQNTDMDIYYAPYEDEQFQKVVRLGSAINTNSYEADVFIDPNEQYIIFCADRAGGLGRGDLYISFKEEDGTWSQSVNMGEPINTVNHELCPYVTPDGKYFLYTSNEDIYWVSTALFYQLRK